MPQPHSIRPRFSSLASILVLGFLAFATTATGQSGPLPSGDTATMRDTATTTDGPAADPKVDIRLALHATQDEGPTQPRGWAGGRVGVGGTVTVVVGAGRFLMPGATEPRCTSFANSMPFEALRHDLAEPSAVWELTATVEALEQDGMTLAMHWRRMEGNASGIPEQTGGGESRVVIHHGQHRVLDHLVFDDPEMACYSAGVLARIEVDYLGYEAVAHLPVRHRLWLIQEIDGEEILSPYRDLEGLQGEKLDFHFAGQPLALGLATTEGEPVEMVGRVTGSVTAWWRDGTVQLTVLDARSEHRLVIPGADAGRFSSGSGAMRFEARPGEVIDIEIPEPYATIATMGQGLEPQGPLPEGLTLEDGLLRLDGRTLLGNRRTALRLEVLAPEALAASDD